MMPNTAASLRPELRAQVTVEKKAVSVNRSLERKLDRLMFGALTTFPVTPRLSQE